MLLTQELGITTENDICSEQTSEWPVQNAVREEDGLQELCTQDKQEIARDKAAEVPGVHLCRFR